MATNAVPAPGKLQVREMAFSLNRRTRGWLGSLLEVGTRGHSPPGDLGRPRSGARLITGTLIAAEGPTQRRRPGRTGRCGNQETSCSSPLTCTSKPFPASSSPLALSSGNGHCSTMALVLDFDGTITVQDTINVLAQSALKIHRERGRDLSHTWDEIVDLYIKSHAKFKANYPLAEDSRLDQAAESKYLASMRDVEVASAKRVEASGIFDGISSQELATAGTTAIREGDVVLREGLGELLALAETRGWPVYILSVNWSKSFIHGVLHQFDGKLTVVSNEVHDGGRIHSPDTRTFLATAGDKLEALQGILRDVGTRPVVYFGDSTTDMECLSLSSGIVVSSSGDSSLLKTLSRVGATVPHVNDSADTDTLLWARNFAEVLQSKALSLPALLGESKSTKDS